MGWKPPKPLAERDSARTGDVIAALSTKSKHVPYRNSKLTYLLADSLGGDSKCLMFVNVSPAAVNAAESVNSLGCDAQSLSFFGE